MTALKALVADDDAQVRRELTRALSAVWPGLRVVQAVNGVEAWDTFLEHEPALCFLDMRMPGLTGVEVAQRIGERAHNVFLMAPNDRALRSFDEGGALHLVKPLDPGQLASVVAQVQQAMARQSPGAVPSLGALLDRLAGQLRRTTPLEVLEAGEGADTHLLKVDDIVYFEADVSGTRVVSEGGVESRVRRPLKELAVQLDPGRFWQIHRFVVVNQRHILGTRRVDEQTMMLSLRERATLLPVARHFQSRFGLPAADVASDRATTHVAAQTAAQAADH